MDGIVEGATQGIASATTNIAGGTASTGMEAAANVAETTASATVNAAEVATDPATALADNLSTTLDTNPLQGIKTVAGMPVEPQVEGRIGSSAVQGGIQESTTEAGSPFKAEPATSSTLEADSQNLQNEFAKTIDNPINGLTDDAREAINNAFKDMFKDIGKNQTEQDQREKEMRKELARMKAELEEVKKQLAELKSGKKPESVLGVKFPFS